MRNQNMIPRTSEAIMVDPSVLVIPPANEKVDAKHSHFQNLSAEILLLIFENVGTPISLPLISLIDSNRHGPTTTNPSQHGSKACAASLGDYTQSSHPSDTAKSTSRIDY
jgi:hypothetical protein